MARHTIVIEVPDEAETSTVESVVTRRLTDTWVSAGFDQDGMIDNVRLGVVEYHFEQMTEGGSE